MDSQTIAPSVHVIYIVAWIEGQGAVHVIVRGVGAAAPAPAQEVDQPPQRRSLWARLRRWVTLERAITAIELLAWILRLVHPLS